LTESSIGTQFSEVRTIDHREVQACDAISSFRGFASFDDGELIGRDVLQSNTLTIQCFNNGASVLLHVRYELIDKDLMLEHTTQPDGSPVHDRFSQGQPGQMTS